MATQVFSLRQGEPQKLKLEWKGRWKGDWKNLTVSLDGDVIGNLSSRRILETGQEFTLNNGSVLKFKLSRNFWNVEDLQILIDGEPVSGTNLDPNTQLKGAYSSIFVIAGFNLAFGIAAVTFKIEVFGGLTGGVITLFYASVMILLGFLVMKQKSLIALGFATAIFSIDTVLVFMDIILNISNVVKPSFNAGVFVPVATIRGALLSSLFQGFSAITELRRRHSSV